MRNPDVIETDLGEEVVLLDPHTRAMFTLNSTGRVVWRHADETLDSIAARLCAEYEVSEAQARADAQTVITALREAGLLLTAG